MLEKGNIVTSALLALGEVKEYNNNNYEIFIVAQDLLEEVLKEFQLSPLRSNFLEYRELLKSTKGKDYEGRNIYLFPIDAINIVRSVENVEYEIMGEFVHSYSEKLVVIINKKIEFNEIRDTYFSLLKLLLAKKIAELYPQFSNKLEYIHTFIKEEEHKISLAEIRGFDYISKNSAFSRQ